MTERAELETEKPPRHKHTFHGLYYHLGRYGRQDIHLHPCWTEGCYRELVGTGRECDGQHASHRRKTLDGGAWQDRSNEGLPL